MRKMALWMLFSVFVFVLWGCQEEMTEEALTLQTQYDNYRLNEFGEEENFIDYVNAFSLETAHAMIDVEVTHTFIGLPQSVYEDVGFIVDSDHDYYYALVKTRLFDDSERFSIKVTDTFGDTASARHIKSDEALGLSLIRFSKHKALTILEFATDVPFDREPIVLLSEINGIDHQMLFGRIAYDEEAFYIETSVILEEDMFAGVFDVHRKLVGFILNNEDALLLYDDILAFVSSTS